MKITVKIEDPSLEITIDTQELGNSSEDRAEMADAIRNILLDKTASHIQQEQLHKHE